MYAWYELNEKWIKYGIIILKYGVFILFGQTCDERTCHVGTLWPGYRGVPSSQVLLYFHSYMCFPCKYYAGFLNIFWTLLEITHLASWKSYLVIICPKSHEKLTKIEIRSSWIQFEHSLESLIYPIGSHICS